jgi:glucose/arabinose dehydrogenase
MKGLPPNAERTPENNIQLRDTTLEVNGTAHTVQLPKGFTITQFARISGARGIALSPDGVIFVAAYGGSKVYALPDHNRDGVVDSMITVFTGPSGMHGIAFVKGALYVSTTSQVLKLESMDNDREMEISRPIATLDPGGNHSSRTLEYDEKRDKLFVSVGSTCNICEEDNEERATILEMNPDGTGRKIYARGLRNAVGMDIDPRTGALWANSNDADNVFGGGNPLTNENPKEPIFIICEGAHYGWPYGYGFRMRYPFGVGIDTSFFSTVSGPVGQMLAHSAPLGMHFIRGKYLPSRYHGALLNSVHGSWNRTPPAPPRIMAFFSDADGRNATIEDFVTGFQLANGSRWGRTVSVAEGADGAIYATDDNAGVVYRIAYTGEAGRSIKFTTQLEGTTQPGGYYLPVNWTATGVDTFRVLFRLSPLDGFDTLTANSIITNATFNLPIVSAPQAAIRIESLNGLTFAESGYFAIDPNASAVRSSSSLDGMMAVYPNPAKDHIDVELMLGGTINQIEILDMSGRRILAVEGDNKRISVAGVPAGSYLVRVTTAIESHVAEVVISR